MRRRHLLLSFLAVLLAAAVPAAAQSSPDVVEQVEFRGYYLDPGLQIDVDRMEELVRRHPDIGFVALASTPAGGADLVAQTVLVATQRVDTVVVLTPEEGGAVSRDRSDSEIDAALAAAFGTGGDSFEDDFAEVAAALSGAGPLPAPQAGTSPGGGFALVLLLAVVVGAAGLMWWNNRREGRLAVRRLEEARAEIRQQMAALADGILAWSERPDGDSHPEAVAHFRRASEEFQTAEQRLEAAETLSELEELSDEFDHARWELEAAAALVEGREVPPPPGDDLNTACFFDPTHRPGMEEAELESPAGRRTVRVCPDCAERLRQGEHPKPREIQVGGRRVPAPLAPRSYGGGGLDWLDVFSILIGGMGSPSRYSWGRPRRRVGTWGMGGGWGGGGFGSASRSRGGGMGSLGRAMGRARRRR